VEECESCGCWVVGHGPAENEEVMILTGDVFEVCAPLHKCDFEFYTEISPLSLEHLSNTGTFVGVKSDVSLKAVWVASFSHHSLCLFYIVVILIDFVVEVVAECGPSCVDFDTLTFDNYIDDILLVCCICESLTNLNVVEWFLCHVPANICHGGGNVFNCLDCVVCENTVDVNWWNFVDHINVTGLESDCSGGFFWNYLECNCVSYSLFAPVFVPTFHNERVVNVPILELHNASTDWEFAVGLAFLFILFESFLIDDGELCTCEVSEEWSVWILSCNCYVVFVVNNNFVDHFSHELNLSFNSCTVEGELNVFSVECVTVVELNAFTELELISYVVNYFIGFCETWADFTCVNVSDEERVVKVTESCRGGCVVTIMWVWCNNVGCLCDNDVLTNVFGRRCWFIGASCCCCVACWSSCCCFFLGRTASEHCEHHCHNEC